MNASSSPGYRSDIDGLRAIAVLAVIAFHASATLLPGGFVGVDIFFVISGYLITGLIAKGIEDQTFSFADFFTRRIKRIFPAYIVVALATLVASSYLLIPNDYIFYTTSLAASWAFLSNVFFSMLSWGYFGARTEEFPLLHTWSLSVEEQFYFIFPILLLGLYRYLRKHLFVVLVVLALAFVTLSQLKAGEIKSYFLHWPIFSFLRYRRIEITWDVGLLAVALAILLSVLTWKFVESPIRQNKRIRFKRAFAQIYVAPAVLFMSIGLYSYVTEGAPIRFSNDMRELISSYSFERGLGRTCSIRAEDYRKIDVNYLAQHCSFGDDTQTKPQILLIGDSHANHFKPFVEQLSKEARLRAAFHVQGVCRPTNLHHAAALPGTEPTTCQRRNADLLAMAGEFKYVVLAGFWAEEMPTTDLEKDMAVVVEKIIRSGSTPVIFKDNPYYEPDLSQCILHRKRGWIAADTNCHIPYQFVAETQGSVDQIIDRVAARYPGAVVVDPKRVMCNDKACVSHLRNIALYKDSNHINAKASKLLAQLYGANIANPFAAQQRTTGGSICTASNQR